MNRLKLVSIGASLFSLFLLSSQSHASADRTIHIYNQSSKTIKVVPTNQTRMNITQQSTSMPILKPGQEGSYRIHDNGDFGNSDDRLDQQSVTFSVSDVATNSTLGNFEFHHAWDSDAHIFGDYFTTIVADNGLYGKMKAACGADHNPCLWNNDFTWIGDAHNADAVVELYQP